jgi:uncharacterized membrane protein YccC
MNAVGCWISSLFQRRSHRFEAKVLMSTSVARALAYGLRLWACVSLALFIAYWLQLDDAYWAATSAAIVAQPDVGASVRKGRFRAMGTILGGVLIVVLIAIFPQSRVGFLSSIVLWGAICGYFATILPGFAGYAAALAGYTAAIVFSKVIDNPADAFLVSVTRVTEIMIGVICAEAVHTLTDFGDAHYRLARAFADVGEGIVTGVIRNLLTKTETEAHRTERRHLIREVIALEGTIDEAIGEPTHLRYHPRHLHAAVEGFFDALSAWRGIADHLCVVSPQRADTPGAALLPAMSAIAARDWLADPVGVRETFDLERQRVIKAAATDFSSQLLFDRVAELFRALERGVNGLVFVEKPGKERRYCGKNRLYVPDPLPAALNALRIAVALSAAILFWIATEYADGPLMITFTAVGVILFVSADAYPSLLEFTAGTVGACVLAALLKLAILPALNGDFFILAFVLACVFVPLGALAARSWHTLAFVAMVSLLMPILALENETSYDGARLINSALAISTGMVVATFFTRLIPPLTSARRAKRLLALTLHDLRGLVIERRRFAREDWVGLVSRRLEAMPGQATPEEEAQLLAAMSVGEAAITLLDARPHLQAGAELDRAFASFADANVPGARQWLHRFCDLQPEASVNRAARGMQAAVQATLIAEALQRHVVFFASYR